MNVISDTTNVPEVLDLEAIRQNLSNAGLDMSKDNLAEIAEFEKSKIASEGSTFSKYRLAAAIFAAALSLSAFTAIEVHHNREIKRVYQVTCDSSGEVTGEYGVLIGTLPSSEAHQAWLDVLSGLSITADEHVGNKTIYGASVDASDATQLSLADGSTVYENIDVKGNVVTITCEKNEKDCSIFLTAGRRLLLQLEDIGAGGIRCMIL